MNFKYKTTREEKLNELGEGEWINEPDQVDFTYKDIPCRVIRQEIGHLCGYIKVPNEHKFYKLDYDDIDIDVHGGITFNGSIEDAENEFWIGFDCAHWGDVCPKMNKLYSELSILFRKNSFFKESIYRNVEYCTNECKRMVDQL
jgi:hypothetical protein